MIIQNLKASAHLTYPQNIFFNFFSANSTFAGKMKTLYLSDIGQLFVSYIALLRPQTFLSFSGVAITSLKYSLPLRAAIYYSYYFDMAQNRQSYLDSAFRDAKQAILSALDYCRKTSESQMAKVIEKTGPLLEKTKEFYCQHQKVILVASTAAIVYLLLGRSGKSQQSKDKKKKQGANKFQSSNKLFASDDSGEEYKEDPSTTVRVESSGKESSLEKKITERLLERIQSSSEEQETGDKIFFEMYEKYQNS